MGLIDILERHYTEAVHCFPKLRRPFMHNDCGVLEGEIDVVDQNGFCWGSYRVRILFPPTYPLNLPRIFETSEKITRHEDWHVNKDGKCCLGTDAKQYRYLADGITLIKWLVLFVVPFFANHIHRLETGNYADGELSHGAKGLFEDYSVLLKITDFEELMTRLRLMAGVLTLSMNVECFCSSGKKYKRCYVRNAKKHMMGIPKFLIIRDSQELRIWNSSTRKLGVE